MTPSELNNLKATVTMPSVDDRLPFGHAPEHRKHIASFCGTGNNVQFLTDTTGNRRWMPFEVERIDNPRSHPFNYEGIYAQAYALYQEGFQYWMEEAESERMEAHTRDFRASNLAETGGHLLPCACRGRGVDRRAGGPGTAAVRPSGVWPRRSEGGTCLHQSRLQAQAHCHRARLLRGAAHDGRD